jgi:hypothetical protein
VGGCGSAGWECGYVGVWVGSVGWECGWELGWECGSLGVWVGSVECESVGWGLGVRLGVGVCVYGILTYFFSSSFF